MWMRMLLSTLRLVVESSLTARKRAWMSTISSGSSRSS